MSDLENDPVDVGDPFNLQVTYTNSGTAPVDEIVLTLTLDAYVSFVSAQVTPVITPTPGNGNVGRWELGSLAGESESSFLIWYAGRRICIPFATDAINGVSQQRFDSWPD